MGIPKEALRYAGLRARTTLGALCALALVLSLTACDSVRRDRVLVAASTPAAACTGQYEAEVLQALADVAGRFALRDHLAYAREAGVIAYYREEIERFPVQIGARRDGCDVVVDIQHFAPGSRETHRYRGIRGALVDALVMRTGEATVRLIAK